VRAARAALLCLALAAPLAPATAAAREVLVPLRLDAAFLQRALVSQVYTDPGETARVVSDARDCNRLVLSAPVVEGAAGRLRVRTQTEARVGTLLGEICTLPIESRGFVELFLEPSAAPGSAVLSFRVVDSNVYDLRGRKRLFSGVVWDWVKGAVHPRLAAFQVDLARPLADLRGLLPLLLPSEDAARTQAIVDSLAIARAEATPEGVTAWARIEVPARAAPAPPAPAGPEAPLSAAEHARFEAALSRFDGFLTFVVKHAGKESADTAVRQELLVVLLDARQELLERLDPERPHAPGEPDPVRALFVETWTRLAPALRKLSGALPGEGALQLLGFVAAADAVAALDALGPDAGLELSEDGLRRMARLLAPSAPEDPVATPSGVDPELREVFGFGPPIEEAPAAPEEVPPSPPLGPVEPVAPPGLGDPVVLPGPVEPVAPPGAPEPIAPSGPAGPGAPEGAPAPPAGDGAALPLPWLFIQPMPLPELAKRLHRFIPDDDGLESYLLLVRDVLRHATELALAQKDLPELHRPLFSSLVLATAWKESCWRQWVRRGREVVTIRSSVGALGLMQVSPRVWRGFYEPRSLEGDIAYNARAGAEILLHYLVDIAIPRGEGKSAYGPDGLARSTYAIYNGGPRHASRWRNPKARASLRRIDAAFHRYYQVVKAGRELEVKDCWGP
jgi:hypothetical protein